jgi:mannosyltransferase OCH1-like enzyme
MQRDGEPVTLALLAACPDHILQYRVEMGIPRILIQTHVHPTWTDAQNLNRRTMQKLRAMNPAWQHMYYNPQQVRAFIAQSMPARVLRAYDALSAQYGPAKADLFRYIAMYVLGGVYLDCKCSCLVPLDVLIQKHARVASGPLLGHWSTRHTPNATELNHRRGE